MSELIEFGRIIDDAREKIECEIAKGICSESVGLHLQRNLIAVVVCGSEIEMRIETSLLCGLTLHEKETIVETHFTLAELPIHRYTVVSALYRSGYFALQSIAQTVFLFQKHENLLARYNSSALPARRPAEVRTIHEWRRVYTLSRLLSRKGMVMSRKGEREREGRAQTRIQYSMPCVSLQID